jgi:hypothetical protein
MSATRLPDGSVVMRPSGQRAVTPKGSGTGIVRPSAAKAGPGGKAAGVRGKQPGRGGAGRNAYK